MSAHPTTPEVAETPVVLAKFLLTERVHIGGRRYKLMLKIGNQSFSVGEVGTAKEVVWLQSQLAIALSRLVKLECDTATMIERLSHFPNAAGQKSLAGAEPPLES